METRRKAFFDFLIENKDKILIFCEMSEMG